MPKLWNETIAEHRSAVEEAIMDKTAELAARDGLTSVTMSGIAEAAGIGRATLYKYFSDIGQILAAWHSRQIDNHLRALEQVREGTSDPKGALEHVLLAYGEMLRHRRAHALAPLLHGMPEVSEAHDYLQSFVAEMIENAGMTRGPGKASAQELARFAVSALAAAQSASSRAVVQRLVAAVMRGIDTE